MSERETQGSDIAVIGLAGRFPKAPDVATFWQNLRNGIEAISFFSDDELKQAGAKVEQHNPNFVKARGILEGAEKFDGDFFGINPKEAEIMDPQHRVFLECAWEALEDGGYAGKQDEGLIGVYAGMSMNTYLLSNIYTRPDVVDLVGAYQIMIGNDKDYLPTRVSYKLNLRGPSVNVQTACSTSLVAVCVACEQLLNLQCDMALAGGVSVTFPQKRGYLYQEGGIASPDGHCRAFDADAKGTVSGDGVGIVLLKRLEDAMKDGDHIYAVIKGFATNNDGALKAGYTAPSPDGQAEVVALAQGVGGIDPATIGYVVTHGTGTPLGDPIEIEGLTKAFRAGTTARQYCAISSVKTNIGHLDAAAGIAGLINAILAVYHGEIPPSLHFRKANPKIDFARSPFFVNTKLREWAPSQTPRRAGVSSFGIGGTNAHVVIEQPPALPSRATTVSHNVLLLSAKSSTALEAMSEKLASHLEKEQSIHLADVAYTLAAGRAQFDHRRAVVCQDPADAVVALRAGNGGRVTTATAKFKRGVAFMFPGQGAQYLKMGATLYRSHKIFREQVDGCAEMLRPYLGFDLREAIYPELQTGEQAALRLTQTSVAQPALFVIEYALAKLWMSWGIVPQALIGHSIGEYVAACIAGVFTLKEALALVAERGRLMQSMPEGSMLAVRLPEAEVKAWLTENVCVATINSPGNTVLSGPKQEIEAVAALLASKGIAAQKLHTSHAFHSSMMEPICGPFAQAVGRCHLRSPRIPFVSNVTGTWITAEQATDPVYWANHLRHCVRFAAGVGELLKVPNLFLLEVGPGRTLSTFAKQTAAGTSIPCATSLPASKAADGEDSVSLLTAAGEMWANGVELDWNEFYGDEKPRRISLPTYPFEQRRYWIEPGQLMSLPSGTAATTENTWGSVSSTNHESRIAPTTSESDMAGALRTLFTQLSGLDAHSIGSRTNFTELGFDSLFLTQVSQAVEKQFGIKVPFGELLERFSTLELLTQHLEESSPRRPSIQVQTEVPTHSSPRATAKLRAPLTEAQKEIWFAAQHGDDASCVYNESNVLRLKGPLDLDKLRAALQTVYARHEALRTIFATDGESQEVRPDLIVEIPLLDLTSESDPPAALASALRKEAREPFDLANGPLFRCRLLRLGPELHALLICAHHLVCDGASFGIILRELSETYTAASKGIPCELPKTIRYTEYAENQRANANSPEKAADERYWLKQYETLPAALELPLDFARTREAGFTGAWESRTLQASLCKELSRISAGQKSTLFQTFLAAYYVFLHRLTGQEEIVVGVPVAERSGEGAEKLVGHCVNFLPLRSQLRGNVRFVDYLQNLRAAFMEALAHQSYTFGTLVQKLKLPRDRSRPPIVSATFNMVWVRSGLNFNGLEVELKPNPFSFSNFELTFNITETDGNFALDCSYQSDLLTSETVRRWMSYFETMLESIAANPEEAISRLGLIPKAEREQLLVTWSNTAADFPRTTLLHEIVEQQAREEANAVAISRGTESVTFAELNELAEGFAAELQRAGLEPQMPVTVCSEVSVKMLAACLGVLKAGGTLVALGGDPRSTWNRAVIAKTAMLVSSPEDRLTEFQGKFVALTAEAETHSLQRPIRSALSAEAVAVLVPSGNTTNLHLTGYSHRALVNIVSWLSKHSRAGQAATTLQLKKPGTERFIQELFLTWSTGGRLLLPAPELSTAAITQKIIQENPQRVFLSDSQLSEWHQQLTLGTARPDRLQEVIIHAAQGPQELRELRDKLSHCSFLVLYGGGDAGVATAYRLNGGNLSQRRIPVGQPISNVQVFILDSEMNPVPAGVPGRLFIGGESIPVIGLPPETVPPVTLPNLSSGRCRIVETGDLARYLPDGNIEILRNSPGKAHLDDWIVDLIALEKTLMQNGGVKEAAVVLHREAERATLIAYAVAEKGVAQERIESYLQSQVPVGGFVCKAVLVKELPRTATRAIDYTRLQETQLGEINRHIAPRTTTEKLLAEIWCEVIGLEKAGVHDNFFELGGHSVLVTQVIARIRKVFELEVGLRTIFERPTIAELAETIEGMLMEEIDSLSEEEAERLTENGVVIRQA